MKSYRGLEPRVLNRSWSWALRAIIMPMGDITFRHPMMRRLAFLEQAQWWSRGQLHEYRDRALRSLLSISYNQVPFYRQLMDSVGVRPEEVRGARDLLRLPVVTKAMMRKSYPASTTRNTGFRTYEASSSGSTGTNFYVKEDTETAGCYRASF